MTIIISDDARGTQDTFTTFEEVARELADRNGYEDHLQKAIDEGCVYESNSGKVTSSYNIGTERFWSTLAARFEDDCQMVYSS